MNREGNAAFALVVGASSGIGQAIAETFADAGWRVAGTSRRAAGTEAIAAGSIAMLPVDVTDDASVAALHGRLDALGLSPDLLVISAGYGIAGPIESTPVEAVHAQFDTNVFGLHRIVRAFLPAMRARGSGKIMIIGSIAGAVAMPFQGVYSASKFAVAGYAQALRHELAAHGVVVTLIEPGDHKTGFGSARTPVFRATAYEPIASRVLAIQFGTEAVGAPPKNVARAVLRLAAASRPPFLKRLGTPFELVLAPGRHFLPASWYDPMVRAVFKMGGWKR